MTDVINMHEYSSDARTWDAEQMLQDALHELRAGKRSGKKAMILWLDDSNDDYLVGFSQCGMNMPQCILLCEVGKDRFKQEMYDAE